MKRAVRILVAGTALVWAFGALAHEGHEEKKAAAESKKEEPKTQAIQGEIVDMGCFVSHGARGGKHKSCATKCIAGGMPMGLLTEQGKLYLLTLNHDDPDPFAACKGMAAEKVEISGLVSERVGIPILDVTKVTLLAAATQK